MNLMIVKNKITLKLLALTAFSLAVSTLIFLFLTHNFSFNFWTDPSHYTRNFIGEYNSIILLIFLFSIGIFLVLFIIPVNRRLNYIQYLAREVQRISEENALGLVVEIRGKDELAELGLSINAMSRELKGKFEYEREVEKTKNELITNISHDLRSPLTSIIGYLELIKEHKFKNEAEFSDYLNTIYNKSQNLKELLEELFEYTKLSNPGIKFDYQRIKLGSLLEQVAAEYIPVWEREGLRIQREIPQDEIEVDLDAEKMVRVFQNLLENAGKYSVKPSEIGILVHKLPQKVQISFTNKVKQLPVQPPEKLFERFYKGDSSRSEENSSGLGLAIAKRIVELHGGRIGANYLDNAIVLTIELPISQPIPDFV